MKQFGDALYKLKNYLNVNHVCFDLHEVFYPVPRCLSVLDLKFFISDLDKNLKILDRKLGSEIENFRSGIMLKNKI